MKKIILEDNNYELIKDYKNGFDYDALILRYTDYFKDYDYILGDWAYNKLRLKGFCSRDNKLFNDMNDYNNIEKYINDNCAYDCRYFIIKKRI